MYEKGFHLETGFLQQRAHIERLQMMLDNGRVGLQEGDLICLCRMIGLYRHMIYIKKYNGGSWIRW